MATIVTAGDNYQVPNTLTDAGDNTQNRFEEEAPPDASDASGTPSLIDIFLKLAEDQAAYVPASTINRTSSTAVERQAMVAGLGEVIPIIYGETRVGAKVCVLTEDSGYIYILAAWALGECESVEHIYVNGVDVKTDSSIHIASYTGTTSQVADPTLSGLITGYGDGGEDKLIISKNNETFGICYSVLKFLAAKFPSDLQGQIQGKKVYDPATTLTEYSTSPALCLRDYLTSSVYGLGVTVNAASVAALKTFNAYNGGAGDSTVRTLNYAIDKQANVEDHIATLRTYASCFVVVDGDEVKFIPNGEVSPASITKTFTTTDFIQDSVQVTKRGRVNDPTVVTVVYTDTTAEPWKDERVTVSATGVDTGAIEYRESVIRLPGITDYGQAYREAKQRLNTFEDSDLQLSAETFDESLEDLIGDVCKFTHPIGLTNKEMRITTCNLVSPGRWRITASEYNAGMYDTSTNTISNSPDTTLPDPLNPDAPTFLSVDSSLWIQQFKLKSIELDLSWTAPTDQAVEHYRVKGETNSGRFCFDETTTNINLNTEFYLRTLEQINISVYAYSGVAYSDALTGNTTPTEDTTTADASGNVTGSISDATGTFSGDFDGTLDTPTGDLDGNVTIDGGTTLGALVAGTGNVTYAQAAQPGGGNSGDLWIDTDDGNKIYRYSGSAWVDMQDDAIGAAQSTADGKVTTFAQTTSPTAEGTGDLWIDTDDGNKLYRWNGSTWVDTQDTDIASAQATADGKIVTFYQDASPTAEGTGDLWVDTNDKNKLYRWSGSAWVSVRDTDIAQALEDAANAQTTADDKAEVFYATTAPTGESGDLWVDSNDGNKLYRHNGSTWVDIQDTDISAAQATADGKIVTFAQAAQPTAEGSGDLWVDTDDGNKLYRWNGSTWVDTQDTAITDAQATADGKVTTFYSATSPTAEGTGDLWVETDADNKLYRWSGSAWVSIRDGTIADAQADATTALTRNKTFYTTSTPTAENTGDLWYSSATETFKRWNGSTWQQVANVGATFGTDINGSISAADVTTFIDANTFTSTTVPTLFTTAAIDEAYIGDLTASKVTTGTLGASVVYAGDIEANQIQAGSLASGVIYTGTLNANQVTTGTLGAVDISATTGTFAGTLDSEKQIRCIVGTDGLANDVLGYFRSDADFGKGVYAKAQEVGVYAEATGYTGRTVTYALEAYNSCSIAGVNYAIYARSQHYDGMLISCLGTGDTDGLYVNNSASTTSGGHGIFVDSTGTNTTGIYVNNDSSNASYPAARFKNDDASGLSLLVEGDASITADVDVTGAITVGDNIEYDGFNDYTTNSITIDITENHRVKLSYSGAVTVNGWTAPTSTTTRFIMELAGAVTGVTWPTGTYFTTIEQSSAGSAEITIGEPAYSAYYTCECWSTGSSYVSCLCRKHG